MHGKGIFKHNYCSSFFTVPLCAEILRTLIKGEETVREILMRCFPI